MAILSKKYFKDEAAAFAHLEGLLWPEGPICPHCGVIGKAGHLEGVRTKPSGKHPEGKIRYGLWKCYSKECRKQFTVRIGTVFECAHIPLHVMLQAVHLLCSSKKGFSAHQLHRILEIDYKSAWFLAHRIREAMRDGTLAAMGGGGKVIEVDETYIGQQDGLRTDVSRYHNKNMVLTLVERGGSARSFHTDGHSLASIVPIVRQNVRRDSDLMTDRALHYRALGREFASHGQVAHERGEYGRGEIHTNTVEATIRSSSAA